MSGVPFDLNAILSQLGREKGINKALLVEVIEAAVLSAAKKHFGHNLILEAKFNEDTGEVEVLQFRTVVAEIADKDTQVLLADAKQFDPEAMVGDEIGNKLPTSGLGRIAAQTAKQVIVQKVRDAERGVIFEEYRGRRGELVNGTVQRYERNGVVVNLGKTDAVLPRREQIAKEKYQQGDRIRAMILDIDKAGRGPQIIITRSHPDFLKKLFELEVPEIGEGIIEIKAVSREAGERAKMAVYAKESGIDPVGACVGVKGIRVQAVVQELRGERIDIITWTPDEPSFVAKALAPAEVARVIVDEDEHSMEVIVNDDQLALAIGKRGQNVKLASRLTGWRLDVRSVSAAEEETKKAREALAKIPGLDFTQAELLFQEGYRSIQSVADATIDDIAEIDGFNEDVADKVIKAAKELAALIGDEDQVTSDLSKLLLSPELSDKLMQGGFKTIQSLVTAETENLLQVPGIDESDVSTIKEAIEVFFAAQDGKDKSVGMPA